MNEKEKGLRNLQKRLQKTERTEKKAEELRKKERHRQDIKNKKAKQIRQKWYQEHRPLAEIAAGIIWKWYQEFIVSPVFKKIANSMRKAHLSSLEISHKITGRTPAGDGDYFEESRIFALDIRENKLFVHMMVKYGRCERINAIEDLLEYVCIPILITMAETITNDTIWSIINF